MTPLIESYGHKIKTIEDLRRELGGVGREHGLVMCHGVFDLVHPGHIRHLLYAKSKADVLLVSITADRHITKGKYRPHVPERLRALNLAALEMVDYVLIDLNSDPLENIRLLQPNYFAKGYEYVSNGKPAKTLEEEAAVASYGGELVFSPGEDVMSSSRIIETSPPELGVDKLLTLMDAEKVDFAQMRGALSELHRFHVHVVGDTIVDSYTETIPLGHSTKTPTLSVKYLNRRDYVGGAAIVAKHLRAAGAEVTFTTVVGDDQLGKLVLGELKDDGIEVKAIVDDTRPTTHKNAIIANGYRLLKIDTLDNTPINDHVLGEITSSVRGTKCDAVIFSDFRHGIFNNRTVTALTDSIPKGVFRAADSQVASRWGNILDFLGFDLITPNEREARFAMADQDSGIRPLASQLHDKAKCRYLMMKLGSKGVLTSRSGDYASHDSFLIIDSFAKDVLDPVGAGDALLAYATLALLQSESVVIATLLASLAAACACEIDGNVPITPRQVLAKLDMIETASNFS